MAAVVKIESPLIPPLPPTPERALDIELASPEIFGAARQESKKEKIKEYRPLWKRVAILGSLAAVAGCASSFLFPRITPALPPTFLPLVMAPFLDSFAKSGKHLLKSISSWGGKALTVGVMVGSAAAWDCLTNGNPADIKNWGLTALVMAVGLRYLSIEVAGYQKPLKD
jgi:hypothetical protein